MGLGAPGGICKKDLLCSREASPGSCKRDEADVSFFFFFESFIYVIVRVYNGIGMAKV